MPPKKQPELKGKAAEKKKKEFVEDKTFGMKNKNKSKKVQQYVQQVHRQARQMVSGGGGRGGGGGGAAEADKKISKKALMEARAAELAMYYRPVGGAGGGGGDDTSRDVRKSTKIDLYVDQRDQRGPSEDPSAAVSQTPQQQQLDATIRERHGRPRGSEAVTSQVVCKHFLDAVESGKYGWFWVCPNGGDQCPHRHALPPGFVVKSKAEQEMERAAATAAQEAALVSVEDEIERERAKLTTSTPVTLEAFLAWKERKRKEREQAERRRRDAALKKSAGSGGGGAAHKVALAYGLSGRDLFQYRPELFVDDADADASKYGERFYEENGEEEETLRRRTEQALQVDEAAEDPANVAVGDASLFT